MPIDPTDGELEYRQGNYQDFGAITRKQIACATCGKSLSNKLETPGAFFVHPLMTTLQCRKCSDFYGDGDFSMDEDGDDKYCRICGNGGELYLCGNKPCPYGFCQRCIKRYLGSDLSEVEADDWKCFRCNPKPLWEVRAICAVILLERSKKRWEHPKRSSRSIANISNNNCSGSEDSDFTRPKRTDSFHWTNLSHTNKKILKERTRNQKDRSDASDSSDTSPESHGKLKTKGMLVKSDSEKGSTSKENNTRSRSRGKKYRKVSPSIKNERTDFKKQKKQSNRDDPSKDLLDEKLNPMQNDASDSSDASDSPESHGKLKTKGRLVESDSKKGSTSRGNNTRSTSRGKKSGKIAPAFRDKRADFEKQGKQSNRNDPSEDLLEGNVNPIKENAKTLKSSDESELSSIVSDSESSHESADDFVKSKKKNSEKQKKISRKNLTMRKKRSRNSASSERKLGLIKLNEKLNNKVKNDKTPELSSELIDKSRRDTKYYSNFVRIASRDKKYKDHRMVNSDSEEGIDNSNEDITKQKSMIHRTRSIEHHTDPERDGNKTQVNRKSYPKLSTLSVSKKKSQQSIQTRKLSTPLKQTTETPTSLLEFNDEVLDRKKAMIKRAYARYASTEHNMAETEVTIIANHVNHLLTGLNFFGRSLRTAADEIAKKHCMNNVTSASVVSKAVLKCALLMLRCKQRLKIIDQEFTTSYESWCMKSKVKSIFADIEDVEPVTIKNLGSTNEEQTSLDIGQSNESGNDSDPGRIVADSDDNLEAADHNESSQILKGSSKIVSPSRSATNHTQLNVTRTCEGDLGRSERSKEQKIRARSVDSKDSERSLKTSKQFNDEIPDCDSREIFSEDEARGLTDKENMVLEKTVEGESDVSNSMSNSHKHEDADKTKSKNKKKGALYSDDGIQDQSKTAENNKENYEEEDDEELSSVIDSVENISAINSWVADIPKNTTTKKLPTHHSTIDNMDLDISVSTEHLSRTGNDSYSHDEDVALEAQEKSPENKRDSHASSSEKERNTLDDTSKDENGDLSDCDEQMIFTQAPTKDSVHNSVANDDENNPVDNVTDSEDTYMSKLEFGSDKGMQSEVDKTITSLNESSYSPEPADEKDEEISDSDSNKINGISKNLKTHKETVLSERTKCNSDLPSDTENDCVRSLTTAEEKNASSEQSDDKSDEESEEAIKRKILESDDSNLSNNSELSSTSLDDLKLQSNSGDSEQKSTAPDTAVVMDTTDSSSNVATTSPKSRTKDSKSELGSTKQQPDESGDTDISQTENISKNSAISKAQDQNAKSNSKKTETKDLSDELNDLAKRKLLSTSSDSDSDQTIFNFASNSDGPDSDFLSAQARNEIALTSAIKQVSTQSKKKKFCLEKNHFYKTDKKLQMVSRVVVRRLDESVLDQFRQILSKSKERQELEEFRSLVDLDKIKKGKRGMVESNLSGSSSDSSSKGGHVRKRSKQVQEKEETLLEHLEQMKNGENYCDLSGNETDENDDSLKKNRSKDKAEEEFMSHANQAAKDLLIQSSDSENEKENSTGEKDEEEPEEELESKITKKKKKQENDSAKEEAADSASNQENGSKSDKEDQENKDEPESEAKKSDDSDSDRTRERKKLKKELSKRNWTLTDSDTSSDEKKWKKSQESKSDKSAVPNEDEELELEVSIKKKKKKKAKRRVLGSDSDSVKLTDQDDSSVDKIDETINSSDGEDSGELFKNLRKKSKRKRNATKKSGSESESEEEAKRPKQKRKRIKKMDSESNSDSDNPNNSQDMLGKLHRKNIRKVLKDKQVADVTKIAGKEEEERLKRIAERQKLYNEMYEMKLASEAKVDKLVLDFDEETKKELVSVHEDLVKRLKPHQAQGIKFMWDACFESLERTKSTKGSGCIVAHCMGLGKTFQVVTLSHTLLTHAETGIKTIMVICPLSTVLNWVNEFKKWLGDINNDEDVRVFEMTKMKKNFERKAQLQKWNRVGGVMVLGYEMFRLLSNQKGKRMRKSQHEEILKCLVDPGPDLIVCDEGHLLKNEDTALSKAMRKVKTLRRIVLTGTPLQNNLVEYHCMVQFVKPNLLGTKKEFLNRFVNPITNGQFDDSTENDVKLMKKRAHVLHKMLEGSVQRFDYSVLTPFLPPKQEYVITVRLADIQIKLYEYYLDNFSRKKVGAGTSLFADFQALQRIWTHPIVLRMNAEKMEKLNEKRRMDASDTEGSLKDFLDDGTDEKTTSSDDSDIQSVNGSSDEKTDKPDKPRRGTRANPLDSNEEEGLEEEQPQAGEWWSQFIEPEHFEDLRISSKLVLLFAILKECEQIGDKVLVFSQSLYALSLIEEFLNKIDDETQRGTCSDLIDNHTGSWSLGLDYFRLDGQTAPENRSQYCKIFNNPKNSRARLFLISTRAGGLGINLTAANRVIIFDASWNPSHDVQSIFRIYRFGQKKPCYVYRFLAQGTMEEKIYNRQVTKLSLSCRVVDEQQIERHYSNHDLAELYQFEPNTSKDKPTLNLPKDRLLAEIFRKYEDRIETFHEHDSLLENKAEEELDEEERKEAWKEYEDERKGRKVYLNNFQNQSFAMQQYNDMMNMNSADIANRATLSGINIETLQALIQKDYPNSTPEQQKMMTQRAILDMYTYMENEAIRQQQMAAAAAASSFNYPTVSNLGPGNFIDKNVMTPAQRQYALQQQQMHQMMVQREQQANYAKRFGNVRGTGLPVSTTRPPQVVQIEDNDVMEVIPATTSATAGPVASSSVTTSSAPAAPAPAENSKRQEE